MKRSMNYLGILILFITFVLSSCTKGITPSKNIQGDWMYQQNEGSTIVDNIYTFTKDSIIIYESLFVNDTGSIYIDDVLYEPSNIYRGTYTISEDQFNIYTTFNTYSMTIPILTFNKNEMYLENRNGTPNRFIRM